MKQQVLNLKSRLCKNSLVDFCRSKIDRKWKIKSPHYITEKYFEILPHPDSSKQWHSLSSDKSCCLNLWNNFVLLWSILSESMKQNNPRKTRKHNLFLPAIITVHKELLVSNVNWLAFYMLDLIKNFNDSCNN